MTPPDPFQPFWAATRADTGPLDAGPPRRVVAEDGTPAWLFTTFEDVRAILSDSRLSADPALPGYPCGPGHRGASTSGSLIRLDGPCHRKARGRLAGEFSLTRIAEQEHRIVAVADLCVDALLASGKGADFCELVGKPAAAGVAAQMLGIPQEHRARFAEDIRHLHDPAFPAEYRPQAEALLVAQLAELFSDRRSRPTDDLIGRLASLARTREEARQLVLDVRLILAASVQTVSSMISLTALSMMRCDRAGRESLRDPVRLAALVEESLRYWSVVQTGPRRVATDRVTVGGVTLQAADGVIVSLPAANRDRAAFVRDRETMDLEAAVPGYRHLAFGFGPHQCLGQNLARAVLRDVLTTVFARIPGLRPVDDWRSLRFAADAVIYGVDRLPVTW